MNLKRALIAATALAVLPASAFAQSVFDVDVTFTPDNGDTTTAFISCNGGVPLDQDRDGLGDGDGVDFVVEETNDATDCTITGADVAGFSIVYTASGEGHSEDGDGCYFTNIGAGYEGGCDIDYEADDVTFTINKVWDISGSGGNLLNTDYTLYVQCTDDITDSSPAADYVIGGYAYWEVIGTAGGDFSVDLDASDGNVRCYAYENIFESSVEVDNGCGDGESQIRVPFGGEAGCTITNTVFYEGIPTLSQYGLAIMALLMLGVGFIGFRRFV